VESAREFEQQSGLSWSEMKSPPEIALEFCRKCLVWPYADVSAAWPNLIFEDLDPKVEANTFDFTDMTAVMAAATKCLSEDCFLVIWACEDGLFAAAIENRSETPPIILADRPVENSDMRLAIMEACIEAWHRMRK
jgi:hypothetical protein